MSQAPVIEKTSRRQGASAPVNDKKAVKASKLDTAPRYAGPRVDLLPPIVEARRRQNATLRLLMLALVGIALIAVVASLAVGLLAGAAESSLADERQRTVLLQQEQAKYTDLMQVTSQLADYDSAQLAALYAEADWARIMRELDAAMPAGAAITSESVIVKGLGTDAAAAPAEGAVAIDAPGVIEIAFTAKAPTFDSPTPLLNALQKMTGYVSADVSAVSNGGEDGYTITGAVRLNAAALGGTARTGQFDPKALNQLHETLMTVATSPPAAPTAVTDGVDTTGGAEGAASTGE